MLPGDRAVFNTKIEIIQETVDGNARFIEHVNKIIDEVDTGLASSANRIITEPSAMADAKEAGQQDDDRTLGIMERIRIFMNKEVIPRITGLQPGQIVFKWGAKDSFDVELPEAIEKAIELKIITPETARLMLEEQYRWKIPDEDEVMDKLGIKPAEEPTPEEPIPEPIPEPPQISEPSMEQSLNNKMKEEKLKLIKSLNQKVGEL